MFKNSSIGKTARYDAESSVASWMPEWSVLTISFTIEGYEMMALNGGSIFKFSPATSFFVNYATEEELVTAYNKLVEGGTVMMALDKYPFAEKYAWISDKFGVSRQLMLAPDATQKIIPCLLFVGKHYKLAEPAMNFYTSLFDNSKIEMIDRYKEGEQDTPGMIKYGKISLDGNQFVCMESGLDHTFDFTQAISYMVPCETQEQIDKLRNALGEGGEFQPCGRVIDKFGVAWQIYPRMMDTWMSWPNGKNVMHAMLQMSKLDLAELKKAAGE